MPIIGVRLALGITIGGNSYDYPVLKDHPLYSMLLGAYRTIIFHEKQRLRTELIKLGFNPPTYLYTPEEQERRML